MSFTTVTWSLALVSLAISAARDPDKTRLALGKAWKSIDNILPQFIGIVLLISLMLAFVTPDMIRAVVGSDTGIAGMLLTSLVGAITLVPGFIAFPLAKSLRDLGAGIPQIAVLVSTLMMVGTVTLPVEIKFFGHRTAIIRNLLAYVASFIVAAVIGAVTS